MTTVGNENPAIKDGGHAGGTGSWQSLITVLFRLSFPFSVLGLLGWMLMFFDALPIAKEFEQPVLFNDFNDLPYLLLLFMLVLFFTVLCCKNKGTRAIASLVAAGAGSWCYVALLAFERHRVDPNGAPRAVLGLFVHAFPNALPFTLLGLGLMMLVASELVHALDRAAARGKSGFSEVAVASCITAVVPLFHEWLLQHHVLLILAAATPVVALAGAVLDPEGKRGMNGDGDAPLFQRGRRKLATGTAMLVVTLLASFVATSTATVTFFYFVVDLAIVLVSTSVLVATCVVEVLARVLRARGVTVTWKPVFVAGMAMLAMQMAILLNTFTFSDSTYETNPPFPFAGVMCGLVLGCFMSAMLRARTGFEPFYKHPDKAKRRNAHVAGHDALAFALIGGSCYGTVETIGQMSASSGIGETLSWGIPAVIIVTGVLVLVFAIDHAIGKKKAGIARPVQAHVARPVLVLAPRQRAIAVACVAIALLATLVVTPVAVRAPGPRDGALTTRVILRHGGCTFAEVSPLVRVGRFAPLVESGVATGAGEGVVALSLARNEFEPVQVAIRNDGFVPVTITNTSITNSSFGGLPPAFARPDVVKSWKNGSWYWPRFVAHHVAEMQPGQPNILYEINDNQTGVENAPGDAGPRPLPVVHPGQVLSLWFTLYAGEDLSAGNYSDTITITSTAWAVNLTLLTSVWNFTLPGEPGTHGMRVAIGNRRVYYLETRDEFTKNFLQHRISPYFPNDRSNPVFFTGNDSFDEASLAAYLADAGNAIDNGIDAFRVTYRPGAFTFTSEFNASTLAFYSRLGNELGNRSVGNTSKTWLDLAIVYAMDEPSEEEYGHFRAWSNLVHQAHPGWKVLLTEQVEPEIDGFVDVWCPHINNVNVSNVAIQHAAGNEFRYYTCCNLVNKPTVSFVEPPTAHQALFWCAFAMNFDGYLFWDAHAYVGVDDLDTYRIGYDGIGDAIMLQNDGNLMPVTTIVWESMRDGIEMSEYFRLLDAKGTGGALLDSVRSRWGSFTGYPRDPWTYAAVREQAGTLLDGS